jgi:hypothetical protein
MRDYYHAQEAKAAGLDWRSALLADWLGDDDQRRVLMLLGNPAYPAVADKVRAFTELHGRSRATWFRCVNRLKEQGKLPGSPQKVEIGPG